MLKINIIQKTYDGINGNFIRLFKDNQISWIDVTNNRFFTYGWEIFRISYCSRNLTKNKFEYFISVPINFTKKQIE